MSLLFFDKDLKIHHKCLRLEKETFKNQDIACNLQYIDIGNFESGIANKN